MIGNELGLNTAFINLLFSAFFVGCLYSVFIFFARRWGLLPKNPYQIVWSVIFGCGLAIFFFARVSDFVLTIKLFLIFFALGFPAVVEHFISTFVYGRDDKTNNLRKSIADEATK